MNMPMPTSGGTWLRHADGSLEEVPPAATPEQLAQMIAAKAASAAVRMDSPAPSAKPAAARKPQADVKEH